MFARRLEPPRMRMAHLGGTALLLAAALPLSLRATEYRSVSVDQSGQLHIVLDSGREILPQKVRGQVSFGAELPLKLIIYPAGRVLHKFTAEQVFWDWQFQDSGKRVAYSTGPTHGGAAECVLRDVESGRTVARWSVKGSEPPPWAQTLRQ
jgi:hypothetical protein